MLVPQPVEAAEPGTDQHLVHRRVELDPGIAVGEGSGVFSEVGRFTNEKVNDGESFVAGVREKPVQGSYEERGRMRGRQEVARAEKHQCCPND